jgi:hypothetical protein
MRALTAYQALILLAKRGFASESRATCRNVIEAKFRLAYILNKPDAEVLLIAKSEASRAKRLKAQQSGRLRTLKGLSVSDLEALIREAEANQKDSTGKKLKFPQIEKLAEDCGLEQEYLGPYSILSEATHSGVVELESYLKLNAEKNMVVQYLYGPQDGDWVGLVTLLGSGALLDCMEISARVFNIRSRRDFDIYFKRLLNRQDELEQRFIPVATADEPPRRRASRNKPRGKSKRP